MTTMSYLFQFVLLLIGFFVIWFLHVQIKKSEQDLKMKKNMVNDVINSNLVSQEIAMKKFIELIDIQIDLEVTHKFLPFITSSKKMDTLQIDGFCNDISESVYKHINKPNLSRFTIGCKLYENSFWLNYIVKKTTCMVMQAYLNTVNKHQEE